MIKTNILTNFDPQIIEPMHCFDLGLELFGSKSTEGTILLQLLTGTNIHFRLICDLKIAQWSDLSLPKLSFLDTYYILFCITVVELPVDMHYGPKLLPSPKGDGVVLLYKNDIFELICTTQKCDWIKKSQRLQSSTRTLFVAFYIPPSLANCN